MSKKTINSQAIVETKLFPSVGAGNPIRRYNLLPPESFSNGHASVYLLKAPAGYGKSTLMSEIHQWAQHKEFDATWLSLDPEDNDPGRLLRYLITAVDRTLPDLIKDSHTLSQQGFLNIKATLEALAFELGNLKRQLIIIMDDLQFIQSPETLEMLNWMINYTPPNCQFVLGSREEPQLKLGKLRVRRKLVERDIKDLAFTLDQSREFLNTRLPNRLTEAEILALHQRTEGWPAGLELAVITLETQPQNHDLIEKFSGTDQNVVDYLGEVMLSSLDPDLRKFIYQIAQFDRVNGELAAHISDRKDAPLILEQLRIRNMFLVPLDSTGDWYRFHHFIASYLRGRSEVEASGLSYDTLNSGATWFYERGHPEEAIACATRNQNWQYASDWVEENAAQLNSQKGNIQTLMRWIDAIPEEWLHHHPQIRCAYAFAMAFYSGREESEQQLKLIAEHRQTLLNQSQPDTELIAELDCALTHLQATYSALRDEGETSYNLSSNWLENWPNADAHKRGDMLTVKAFGHKSRGEIEEGLQVIAQSRECAEAENLYFNLMWSYWIYCFLLFKAGRYQEARPMAEKALQMVEQQLGGERDFTASCHTILAAIAYELGDIEKLEYHVGISSDTFDEFSQADFIILKYLSLARFQFAKNDPEAALTSLRQGQAVGAAQNFERVLVSLAAEECVWLCRLNRIEEAEALLAKQGIPTEQQSGENLHRLLLDKSIRTGSRVLLLKDPKAAIALLEAGITTATDKGFLLRQVELLLITTMAHKAANDKKAAKKSLINALEIAGPQGYYQIFINEAAALGSLISALKPSEVSDSATDLLNKLQQALRGEHAVSMSSADRELIEKLSKREQQILKRLESELSNKEIAEALFVSEGTLKWHLHNIYGKLGVRNRPGALVKARELGYL
ncbi:tetratricopeptide repeat protein [Spongiibacter sp. KMU-158]|uniref:Tetratricopeptide repeat protein n=1 Tax=Spongiibacter pelagi TaxID=2760804 RepID=A0A927C476_9GAMM|nr:LuxR C-terminal-related transcriptional regulator [Spongiibacter pelagi]MBD2859446.1 tetratricopeptide repeat protein [Spongiibacter pelagi]